MKSKSKYILVSIAVLFFILMPLFFVFGSKSVSNEAALDSFSSKSLGDLTLSVGGDNSSVIRGNDVYIWGKNSNGQVGNGTREDVLYAEEIEFPGLNNGDSIKEVKFGGTHSAALTERGEVYTWGKNDHGQLGNGTTSSTDVLIPTKISFPYLGIDTTVESIELGESHSAALTSNGEVYTWGNNDYGQLGNGADSPTDVLTPTLISFPGISPAHIAEVSLGNNHSIALTTDQNVYIWGDNRNKQIGVNTLQERVFTPIKMTGTSFSGSAVQVELGGNHSAVLNSYGRVFTWGQNDSGQVGNGLDNGQDVDRPHFVDFPQLGSNKIEELSLGKTFSSALDSEKRFYIWGNSDFVQTGGSTENVLSPILFELFDFNIGETISSLSLGNNHGFVISSERKIFSWGSNSNGQMGLGLGLDSGGSYANPKRVYLPIIEGFISTSEVDASSANVSVNDFENGFGDEGFYADYAKLTYSNQGTIEGTVEDNDLDDGVFFTLNNLKGSTRYDIDIEYFHSHPFGDIKIGNTIESNLLTTEKSIERGSILLGEVTSNSAIVNVDGFSNGTGSQEANRAVITYEIDNSRATLEDNDLTDGISFNLTGLEASKTYSLSIGYFKDSVKIGGDITGSLTTSEREIVEGSIKLSNVTPSSVTVEVIDFINGTEEEEANKAVLTYEINNSRATLEDNDLSDGISFNLTGLNDSSTYSLSISYFNNTTQIGDPITEEVVLPGDSLVEGTINIENIGETTAEVRIEGFENGFGTDWAEKAVLTLENKTDSSTSTVEDTDLNNGVFFNLTDLDPSTIYDVEVAYYNSSNSQIGSTIVAGFRTNDVELSEGNIQISGLTSNSVFISVNNFSNGSGPNHATSAKLKYNNIELVDNDLSDGMSWFLTDLTPSTRYDVSLEYYSNETKIGDTLTTNFTTHHESLSEGSIDVSDISTNSATVSVNNFSNGSGPNLATRATLTYTPSGGSSQTMDDNNLSDGVSFNLENLEEGTLYNLTIRYYQNSTQIGSDLDSSFTTIEERELIEGNIVVRNQTNTSATINVENFTNGTEGNLATKAVLTYGVSGGTNQTMEDNNLNDGISFSLTGLTPSTTYNLSISYFNDSNQIGSPITETLVTNDSNLVVGEIEIDNLTTSSATVIVNNFTNGTGDNLATRATLTYGLNGGASESIDDNNLSDGISFNLENLEEETTYNLTISYYSSTGKIDEDLDGTLTTKGKLHLNKGNIVVTSKTNNQASIIVDNFTNGTEDQQATKAVLSYGPSGGTNRTMEDNNLADGISFNLTGLTPSTTYNLSVSYFNNSSQIDTPITSTLVTDDSNIIEGQIQINDLTPTGATIVVNNFSNGTGANLATKAILSYGNQTMEDNDLTNGVSFTLTNLVEGNSYNLSLTYYDSNNNRIGNEISSENPLIPQTIRISSRDKKMMAGILVGTTVPVILGLIFWIQYSYKK